MNDSRTLVEHYFRHEYGRLVALLTRSFGIRNIELIEDVVQSALYKAMQTWRQKGIPDNPGAWLYRTSHNIAIDAIRRSQTELRLLQEETAISACTSLDPTFRDEVGDESLRLLFLSCHPSIPRESSVAFALKTVGGFSTVELSSALLITKANAEKRISRAKEKLREIGAELTELDLSAIESRIDAVQSTIYLLFNEGYSSSSGQHTLRKDLCEEAIRLARMLIGSTSVSNSCSYALLSLMLMHFARLDSRLDKNGSLVLLEDQDRSKWDWRWIREAMDCMAKSTNGDQLSRYHIEAAIAWEHCRANSFSEIDWRRISDYYANLMQIHSGPMVVLNHAIAMSYSDGPDVGLVQLTSISLDYRSRLRPWWDCAIAEVFFRLGKIEHAISHWQDAKLLAACFDLRELIEKRIFNAKGHLLSTKRCP